VTVLHGPIIPSGIIDSKFEGRLNSGWYQNSVCPKSKGTMQFVLEREFEGELNQTWVVHGLSYFPKT
jgi:hypothetical protein